MLMVRKLVILFFVLQQAQAQTIPAARRVDWSGAGLKDTSVSFSNYVDVTSAGVVGDSTTINDQSFQNILNGLNGLPSILYFPPGNYLFTNGFTLPSNIIIRGHSVEQTRMRFNLAGAASNLFNITGTTSPSETFLLASGMKGDSFIRVNTPSMFSSGDYLKLFQNDSSLVTSTWAYKSVAQVVRIVAVSGDTLFLESPLRRNYLTSDAARVIRITPKSNVGFECFYIERLDATSSQTSNFNFDYSASCWIRGVESNMTNFSHATVSSSTNLLISGNYFHHAFNYGGGGKAYGVTLQFSSGEVLVENNIFNNLRHSMLLQAGANGNVLAYNYSFNPYWTQSGFPTNSAGDIVLHGNYVFANLIEGNICQNIIIDDSHGINGPFNTFFRNRAELYGILMNENPPSNDQNFVGNEVTNTGPFLGNYYLRGIGHFEYGNNVKGTLIPSGTSALPESSYYLTTKPSYFQNMPWPSIGTPNPFNQGTIPAKTNLQAGIFTTCQTGTLGNDDLSEQSKLRVYPNPSNGNISFTGSELSELIVYSITGNEVSRRIVTPGESLNLSLSPGLYFLHLKKDLEQRVLKLIIE